MRQTETDWERLRSQFYLPQGQIYLDGNSLGLLSKPAEESMLHHLGEWKTQAIGGWQGAKPPWLDLSEKLSYSLARLVGAKPDEITVANSTTVNLHQLLATFYSPTPKRAGILIEELAFPTDRYAIESHMQLRDVDPKVSLKVVPSNDSYTVDEARIIDEMTEEVALIILPSVLYTSGQLLDIPMLTAVAHEQGILIGFDCAHSIGAVPHHLSDWGVDFAFWCNYKYLNGGPGAPGGLYLNRKHFGTSVGMAGWFGADRAKQFDMAPTFYPAEGATALQIGTPSILSMAPLIGSLAIFDEVGIEAIRARSLELTAYLRQLIEARLTDIGVRCVTPAEDRRRGGHIALSHPYALDICTALRKAGVVPDFRHPNVIRLAPVSLYNTLEDCAQTVDILADILKTESYRDVGGVPSP